MGSLERVYATKPGALGNHLFSGCGPIRRPDWRPLFRVLKFSIPDALGALSSPRHQLVVVFPCRSPSGWGKPTLRTEDPFSVR